VDQQHLQRSSGRCPTRCSTTARFGPAKQTPRTSQLAPPARRSHTVSSALSNGEFQTFVTFVSPSCKARDAPSSVLLAKSTELSGNATLSTTCVCSLNVCSVTPFDAFHTRTVCAPYAGKNGMTRVALGRCLVSAGTHVHSLGRSIRLRLASRHGSRPQSAPSRNDPGESASRSQSPPPRT